MYYFAGDAHLYSARRIREDGGPDLDPVCYSNLVIRNINEMCTEDDTLVLTGDWVDCSTTEHKAWLRAIGALKELRPNVIFIFGNNEERVVKYVCSYEELVYRIHMTGVGTVYRTGAEIYTKYGTWWATHKPTACIEKYFNVFAHVHVSGPVTPIGFNSAIPLNHYRPWSEDRVQQARVWVKEMLDDPEWKLVLGDNIWRSWIEGVGSNCFDS